MRTTHSFVSVPTLNINRPPDWTLLRGARSWSTTNNVMYTGAQGFSNNERNAYFICVVKLVKPETFEKMSPKEEGIVSAHFERLEKALGEGNLILAGPSLDGEFGTIIFRAQSREQAEEFVKNERGNFCGNPTKG